jgi:hypothetical protein
VRRYHTNYLMGRRPLQPRIAAFLTYSVSVCGISTTFVVLSPTDGQVPTCSSAVRHSECKHSACDLHALGTPPAFVLSQDQTLHCVAGTAASLDAGPPQKTHKAHHHDSVVKVHSGVRRQKTREWLSTHLATSPWQATARIALSFLSPIVASTSLRSETFQHNSSIAQSRRSVKLCYTTVSVVSSTHCCMRRFDTAGVYHNIDVLSNSATRAVSRQRSKWMTADLSVWRWRQWR